MSDTDPCTRLFVYGTLKRSARHGMSSVLEAGARFLAEASMRGRLYMVADYPGFVPSTDPGESVRGELWELTAGGVYADVLLANLDSYEGCLPSCPEASLYRREVHEATLDDGTTLPAFVYIYNRDVGRLRRITAFPEG